MTTNFSELYKKAHAAGVHAADGHTPTPMLVGEPTTLFGSELNYAKPVHYVPQGVCGFAWVNFKGNTAWGKWAKKFKVAKPAYGGGLQIWVSLYGQSMEKKEAYAHAFAKVLNEAGVQAYPGSRMD